MRNRPSVFFGPALAAAMAFVMAAAPLPGAVAGAVDPDLLAGMKARSIGPAGMSGRVAAVDAVESNPDVIWAGAASGGVWKSVNGGLTWRPVFDDQPVAAIGAIAINQTNPDVVWVGTGEANVRNSVSVGNGVYRTLDGGQTWTHLGLDKSERIYRIVLHPSNPDIAWVSALGQLWGENPERGIFKTVDGGKTWNRVLYVNEKTGGADLVMDPGNPDKLYASMWQLRRWPWFFKSGGPGSGLYVTHDGGRTWKKRTEEDGLPAGDLGRIGLAVSRSNPEVVYAMVEAAKSALLRSEDGGKSWRTVNARHDVNPRPFYFGDIRVDPVWPNRVYSIEYNVRVSNDSGRTFEDLPGSQEIHGDFHALWIDPNDPDFLIFANDGGLGISHDRGRTSRFVSNLPLGQFYHVAVDNETPYNVYGGMQDNGSWRGPSAVWSFGGIRNHEWKLVGDGDGFETLPDPADPMAGYSLWQGGNLGRFDLKRNEYRPIKPTGPDGVKLRFNWNAGLATDPFEPATVYLGSQFLHKSADRGETWTTISPDLTSNNPEWQNEDTGGLTMDATAAENHTTIITIAPSPLKQGVIWVGTDDGRVQVTRDGGKTWESVEKNVRGVPANTWVPDIRPSKFDPAAAFAVFDNHRRSDWTPYVYRTDDWGKTWKSLATPDVRGYALTLEQDPVDKDLLFLGTEWGLWVSQDAGRRWMKWTHGLPTVSVMDLAIHPREHDLVIGTHGRAIYILDDIRPLRAVSDQVVAKKIHLFEVADAAQIRRAPDAGGFGFGAGEYYGQNRPYGALLSFWVNDPALPHPKEEKERERKEKERAEKRAEEERKAAAGKTESKTPNEEKTEEQAASGKKDETKKKDEEKGKEVEIRIADATGKVIRTQKVPAKQGLNRVSWNLRRNALARQLPPDPDEDEPNPYPAGPEVVPGTYQVTVRYAGQESTGTVKVLGDPRFQHTAEDWRRREEAVDRALQLEDVLSEALHRIRRTRADVQALVGQIERRKEDEEERARIAGTAFDKKDEKPDPVVEAAEKLQEGLTTLEKKIWVPPGTPGILPERDALNAVGYAGSDILSTYEPPSPTHLDRLRQAEAEVQKVLADFNQFFAKEVAEFQRQAEGANLRLMPAAEPLQLKGAGR